jgi:hypothetical protein
MVDLIVFALVLAFAGLCLWLAVHLFVAILPYLVIGLVGWFVWRHRATITRWFTQGPPGG